MTPRKPSVSLPRLRLGHITRCLRFAFRAHPNASLRSALRIHRKCYLPRFIKYIAAHTPIIANKNSKPGSFGVGVGVSGEGV